jgi:hypothetical protein
MIFIKYLITLLIYTFLILFFLLFSLVFFVIDKLFKYKNKETFKNEQTILFRKFRIY